MSACLQSVLHSVSSDECLPIASTPATAPVARPTPPATMPTQPTSVCQLPCAAAAPWSDVSGAPPEEGVPAMELAEAPPGGGADATTLRFIATVAFALPASVTVNVVSAGSHPF